MIHPFQVYTSVLFTVYIEVCGHHHYFRTLLSPSCKPHTRRQPLVCFLSLEIACLDISYLQACSSGLSVSLSMGPPFSITGTQGVGLGLGAAFVDAEGWATTHRPLPSTQH